MGNIIQTSDRNGREISFTYDNLNRNTNEIKNNDQSDEFEFEQKHPVEKAIEKAARERERILEDLIDQNQPLETTVKNNTIDPNNINIDIYEPPSDPFNVERFGDRDYNNDFDPNLDGYELDDTIGVRDESTRSPNTNATIDIDSVPGVNIKKIKFNP